MKELLLINIFILLNICVCHSIFYIVFLSTHTEWMFCYFLLFEKSLTLMYIRGVEIVSYGNLTPPTPAPLPLLLCPANSFREYSYKSCIGDYEKK